MKNKKTIYLMSALFVLLLASGCGYKSYEGSASDYESAKPSQSDSSAAGDNAAQPTASASGQEEEAAGEEEKILIVIDQTPYEGSDGHAFSFSVEQAPEGYALKEVKWVSDQTEITNTIEEMIEHGASGGDGFYISGNGQFSGFIYPYTMEGEKGKVIFVFTNDANDELTWEKELTLK